MTPLVILALWIGVYPKPFLNFIERPVNAVVRQVRPTYPIPGMPETVQIQPAPVQTQQPGVVIK
jgi:hypothetical protein